MRAIAAVLFVLLVAGCVGQPRPVDINIQPSTVSVEVTNAPVSANAGQEFEIEWKVNGPAGSTPHTAVHWGYESRPGTFGTDIGPAIPGYPFATGEFYAGNFDMPATYKGKVNTSEGATKMFYRAHAIVNGLNYWTAEKEITLIPVPMEMPMMAQAKEFTIEADDLGLYPNGTVSVKKGDEVKLTLKVRTSGVSFGGLDFRSSQWGTRTVGPGQSTLVEFMADTSFTFSTYWPGSGVKKADGQVLVS